MVLVLAKLADVVFAGVRGLHALDEYWAVPRDRGPQCEISRDFRYIMPFIVQFGFYLSPVGFSSSVVPEQWRLLYAVNPMVGAIDGFRWCILGGQTPLYLPGLAVGLVVTAFFMWLGIRQFRKFEKTFADLI
jgi:lipopolysaccharide transport system permease protein